MVTEVKWLETSFMANDKDGCYIARAGDLSLAVHRVSLKGVREKCIWIFQGQHLYPLQWCWARSVSVCSLGRQASISLLNCSKSVLMMVKVILYCLYHFLLEQIELLPLGNHFRMPAGKTKA